MDHWPATHLTTITMAKNPKHGRVIAREELPIPLYTEEGITFRLHQNIIELHDGDGNQVAEVSGGAGLGSDHIHMEWKGDGEKHQATFHLRDVLKSWVATFDPEGAKKLPSIKVEVDESS